MSQAVDVSAVKSMEATGSALSMTGLSRSYISLDGSIVEAVADFSLSIMAGEVVALIGPSGCGKSSVLRVLAGLDDAYSGQVEWHAASASGPQTRLRSATVFQADSTLPWMSVARNVELGMMGLQVGSDERQRRRTRFLELVGLRDFQNAYPHELSGGMRQRVAIARALAAEPYLLLMDEPLSALDAQTRIVLQQELLHIWQTAKLTVVYVTHDISEAITLADRIVIMSARPGRIKAVRDVPFPKVRDVLEIRKTAAFGELEVDLWRMIAEEVGQKL